MLSLKVLANGFWKSHSVGNVAEVWKFVLVSVWLQLLLFYVAEAWVEKPSFGKSLEEHLTISGREIAFPIEACVTMLLECGMQEEVEGAYKRTVHAR